MLDMLGKFLDLFHSGPQDREPRGMERMAGYLNAVFALIVVAILVLIGIGTFG